MSRCSGMEKKTATMIQKEDEDEEDGEREE